MKTIPVPVLACSVLAVMMTGPLHAQNEACKRVEFSQAVLERFPRIPEACLDVVSREGRQYAVIKADLVSVGANNNVRVRVKLPDGSHGPTQSIKTKPDFRVLIEGKPTRVNDLAPGQELTAYVHVTEPQVALQPATQTTTLAFVPLEAPETRQAAAPAETPAMPETAGRLPLIGAIGALLMMLGAGLTILRRMRA